MPSHTPAHSQPVWTTTVDYRPPQHEEDRDLDERPVSRHNFYYDNVRYQGDGINQVYVEDHVQQQENRRRFQRAFDEDSDYVDGHTNISIPRPKVYGRSRADTPDDFNFLEDRQLAEYAHVGKKRSNAYRDPSRCYRPNIWSVLNVLQIFIAILLLIFAFFRFFRVFGRPQSNILLDFIKAEDYAQSNQDGTEIIAIKLGSSLFVPCCLQLISGFSGLWPMGRNNYGCLIIHVIFSMLAIVYWFEPINYAAFELNLRNIQLESNLSSLTYHILLTLLVFTTFMVLIVTSLSMCNAVLILSEPCNIVHNPVDVHLGMASVIISVVCCALSVYVSASTLTSVTQWAVPSVRNIAALYGFGLRELIICSYITLATGFCSASTMIQQRNLRLAALVLQMISLLLIFGHLMTADRITAVTHNMKTMFSVGLNRPIGPEALLLLYTFIGILTILLVAHTISTIIALCKNFSDSSSTPMYSQHVDEGGHEQTAYHANI